jgi:hypothetical protein
MAMGVACTVDSRFSAVTTISSRSLPARGGASAVPGGPAAAGSASAGAQSKAAPETRMGRANTENAWAHARAANDVLFTAFFSLKKS